MALSTPDDTLIAASTAPRRRLPGPDVVRAIALIGVVVMNYHGYLIIEGARRGTSGVEQFFDPWTGPLSTRFAATFVLVAGVGVTLLTRRSIDDPRRRSEMRIRLLRRGALLYVGGVLLDIAWAGTIIPYYGAMFTLAAVLFTLPSAVVLAVGLVSAGAGAWLQAWRFWQAEAGESTAWLFAPSEGSVSDFLFGAFVNGTHPLLPWLLYFCVGIVLGRALHTLRWRQTALAVGLGLFVGAELVNRSATTPFSELTLSTNPASRSLVYVASALGTALVAYVIIDAAASRWTELLDPFRRAGQMSLTLYLAHIVVFYVAVEWTDLVVPDDLTTALTFSLVFWTLGIAAAAAWHRRFERGPAEYVYRVIGG